MWTRRTLHGGARTLAVQLVAQAIKMEGRFTHSSIRRGDSLATVERPPYGNIVQWKVSSTDRYLSKLVYSYDTLTVYHIELTETSAVPNFSRQIRHSQSPSRGRRFIKLQHMVCQPHRKKAVIPH